MPSARTIWEVFQQNPPVLNWDNIYNDLHNGLKQLCCCILVVAKQYKNSSGDETANVNFYAVRPEATRIRQNNEK